MKGTTYHCPVSTTTKEIQAVNNTSSKLYISSSFLFVSYRKDLTDKARKYLSDLMQTDTKKNMERMGEVVPTSDHQSLQQFHSDSRWDAQAVMNRVSQNAITLMGDKKEACFLIDESGFEKKGKKSVGVARQWLGRLG